MEMSYKEILTWTYRLFQVGQDTSLKTPQEVQHEILQLIVSVFEASNGSLAMLDSDGEHLVLRAGIGPSAKFLGSKVKLGERIMGRVAKSGKPLLINGDAQQDSRFKDMNVGNKHSAQNSAMCWPIRAEKRLVGAFSVARDKTLTSFTERSLEEGLMLAEIVGLVVENSLLHNAQRGRIEALSELNEQLKEAHEQLLQSEKLASIGQLSAGIAHEINNPVGYIISNISTLDDYIKNLFELLNMYEKLETILAKDPETYQQLKSLKQKLDIDYLKQDIVDLVNESQEGAHRVKKIVQDLKNFSHVDEAEWQWTDLHRGIDSTLNIVNNEIKYKADVIKEYGDLPDVQCMGSQLNQVFMNLLVNASHAIKERGTITIRTGVKGDKIWISVTDTGCGMPAEVINRIFDPFFTTKPVGKGTGLGLSLSYGIVQKHNGKIDIESEEGKGTTFTVWIPIQQADNERAAKSG